MFYIKPYIEAKATPEIKQQIQGEEVGIDEDELATRPEYWRQRIIQDFIGWLRGKPNRLAPHVKLEGFPTEVELEGLIIPVEVETLSEKVAGMEERAGERWYRVYTTSELRRWFEFTRGELEELPYDFKR